MKPHLTICGVHELWETLAKPDRGTPITHLISIWRPPARESEQSEINYCLGQFGLRLPGVPVLVLDFEDISAPAKGRTAPAPAHMISVLAFARRAIAESAGDTHLLVHCRMGVSRSAACALAILAQANPAACARDLLAHLRDRRPGLAPNRRLVRFADEILARSDSLLSACARPGE